MVLLTTGVKNDTVSETVVFRSKWFLHVKEIGERDFSTAITL